MIKRRHLRQSWSTVCPRTPTPCWKWHTQPQFIYKGARSMSNSCMLFFFFLLPVHLSWHLPWWSWRVRPTHAFKGAILVTSLWETKETSSQIHLNTQINISPLYLQSLCFELEQHLQQGFSLIDFMIKAIFVFLKLQIVSVGHWSVVWVEACASVLGFSNQDALFSVFSLVCRYFVHLTTLRWAPS